MDRDGTWRLSPAYDPGNNWLQAHQMTINGKSSNISIDDMIACGQNMDLKTSKCNKIMQEVRDAVKEWRDIAYSVGIKESTIDLINTKIVSC